MAGRRYNRIGTLPTGGLAGVVGHLPSTQIQAPRTNTVVEGYGGQVGTFTVEGVDGEHSLGPSPPPPPPPGPGLDQLWRVNTCSIQKLWCNVLVESYAGNATAIRELIWAVAPDQPIVDYFPGVNNMPNLTRIRGTGYTIACMDGTSTSQQLALQAFQGLANPVDQGPYGTLQLWADAANYVQGRIQQQVDAENRPTFFVGHSYGGAVALILAARFRWRYQQRPIKVLTFGAPKPGDRRLVDLLGQVEARCIYTDTDLIGSLPPDAATFALVAPIFALLKPGPWFNWFAPPGCQLLLSNGELTGNSVPFLNFDVILNVVGRFLAGQPQAFVENHVISAYRDRTALRCP